MYRLVPHTADVRLFVSAPSLEELFRDAMRGMYAVMHAEPAGAPVRRHVTVDESADTTSLLVDFLNELLHRSHVGGEMFDEATFTRFEERSLDADLTGAGPATFEEDVKAVTYHEAEVRFEGGEWTTMLVFDL